MRRISRISLGLLGVAMIALPAGAGEYTGPGFVADMFFAQDGGSLEPMGRIYMSKSTMRYESGGSIVLVDLESGKVVTLMPDQKMYMEMPASQGMAPPAADEPCAGYKERTKQGAGTVDGRAATKWRCSGQQNTPQGMEPSDATVWFDGKLKFWVRSVRDAGDSTELRNVSVGSQPDSLFRIPEGYQQFNMVSAQQMQKEAMQRQDAYMRQMQQEQEAERQHEREMQQMETMNEMMELLLQNQNQ